MRFRDHGNSRIKDSGGGTPRRKGTDPDWRDVFHYDQLGNRMGSANVIASWGSVAASFSRENNGLNQYVNWTKSPINQDDDMGSDWGSPGHANGVTMQEGWITASYNALKQPKAIWSPSFPNGPSGAQFMWLGFDPLGRCVKRWMGPDTGNAPGSNPATYYYYDGWNLIQEGPGGSTADRTYVHGGRVDEVVASQAGGEWVYHHYDARGHCILLTNASNGAIREQYDYDAFGFPYFYGASGGKLGSAFQFGNRFLFTGREWLKDLRVYDYRNRIYQPELGRFLQPDPKGFEAGDYNLYRYCHNDPVNRTDPTGLQVTSDTWNDKMRFQSGTTLSSREFSLLRQGQAYLAPPTGNYKDTKVKNHITKGEIGNRDGGTIYNLNLKNAEEIDGKLIIQPTLNWYVQKDHVKTDVVIRELEHVSRYLYWHGEGDLGVAVRSFNRNPNGFDALKSKLREEKGAEDVWHDSDIHSKGRHNLNVRPAKMMNPAEIEKAILNVGAKETPHIGNPYLGY